IEAEVSALVRNDWIVSFESVYGEAECCRDMARLLEAFPQLQAESIGASVMGRAIQALRIGTGPRKMFVNAAFHANEWITSPLLLRFVEEAAYALKAGAPLRGEDAATLFSRVTLIAVPMVNPDGVELVVRGAEACGPHQEQLLAWNGGSG